MDRSLGVAVAPQLPGGLKSIDAAPVPRDRRLNMTFGTDRPVSICEDGFQWFMGPDDAVAATKPTFVKV